MDIYAAACCLFSPPFPLRLPSFVVLREAIVHFTAPGGIERIRRRWVLSLNGLGEEEKVPGLTDEFPSNYYYYNLTNPSAAALSPSVRSWVIILWQWQHGSTNRRATQTLIYSCDIWKAMSCLIWGMKSSICISPPPHTKTNSRHRFSQWNTSWSWRSIGLTQTKSRTV